MTIEVKQLIIKSTVNKDHSGSQAQGLRAVDIEKMKEMLMEECRELINETLSEMKER